MKRLLSALFILLSLNANADTLGDLNAALKRMAGREPMRGLLSIEQSVKTEGRFGNDSSARVATAEVRHDEAGVSIVIPQALLDRAGEHRWSSGLGENTALDAIGTLRSLDIVQALNFRNTLLAIIENASVSQEKRVAFRGAPARLLVLKLKPVERKSGGSIQLGTVKIDDSLTLWIGDDNLPIAGERITKTTAGFLFLHGTFTARMNYTFTHTHDRLVLTRLETSDGGSGMGQTMAKTSVQTLTLH